jgi:hypothetical protein
MRTRRELSVMFVVALILGLMAVPVGAQVFDGPGGDFGLCDGLEWMKYDYDEEEWSSSEDAPDAEIQLSNWVYKDGDPDEPIGFDWVSDVEVSSVHVQGGTDSDGPFPGGFSGSVETSLTVPGPSGSQAAISFIVFCFGEPGPDTVTITLVKAWFDSDGDLLTEAPAITWGLAMTVSEDGITDTTVAELPGDASAEFEPGDRYGVQEAPAPEGYEAIDCEAEGLDWSGFEPVAPVVNMNTSAVSVALGAPDGLFGATSTGIHLVCNQELEDAPTVVVEEQALRLVKFFFGADGAQVAAPEGDWSATAAVGGVAKIELSGTTTSGWANISGNYTVAETPIAGWSEASCDGFTLPDIGTDYLDVSGTGSFTLDQAEGAHAVCNQAAEVEVLAEVIEKEPEVEAEVLAELPVTGTQASLLALLTVLGLGSIGLGTVLARRR